MGGLITSRTAHTLDHAVAAIHEAFTLPAPAPSTSSSRSTASEGTDPFIFSSTLDMGPRPVC